jgi:hypothetical protein
MTARLITLVAILLSSPIGRAMACSTCFGNYPSAHGGPPPTVQHMAVAIWVMMGAIMSVLGGVGAFGFHLWRHANTPLEPHQELTQEDFEKYD